MTKKRVYGTREAILEVNDVQIEEVVVPQWSMTVRVRGMSGTERDAFEASVMPQPTGNRQQRRNGQQQTRLNMENLRARLCVWCVVDEEGKRVFADADIPALGAKSGAAINLIFDVAMRLSGMSESDVDELAEAMVERPFDDSSSPSPES